MSLNNGPGGLLSDLISATITGTTTVENEGGGKFTLYAIEVINKADGASWTVYRRYSRFLSLQSHMPPGIIPPECTLRKGVLASSTAPEVVDRRRQLLEDFISAVLCQPADLISQAPHLSDFFRLSVPELETPGGSTNNSSLLSSDGGDSETISECDLKSLTVKVNKMSETELNGYLLSLMGKIGVAGIPSVSSIYSLIELQHLVSVETNLDSACIVNAIVNIPGWQSMLSLNNFIRFPTCASSRLMAFKIIRAISRQMSMSPSSILLDDDEVSISQYLAWTKRTGGGLPSQKNQHFSGIASAVLGPQSPLARSVYISNSSSGGGHMAATAAMEAREWVAFTVSSSHSENFSFPGSTRENEWVYVKTPSETLKRLVGQIMLKYRVQGTAGSLLYELRLEWRLPPSVDMERVANLLWDPAEVCPREDHFFGFLNRKGTQCTPVPGEYGNMAETGEFVLNDQRRVGGSVSVDLVRSCMRTFNGRVVIAATADPAPVSANSSVVRTIKHLHYIGCEIDMDKASITGCALLSSESIFLVAGDLLGERLIFWQAVERFSDAVVDMKRASPGTSKMSEWLATSR